MITIALGILLAVFILFNLHWILPLVGKVIVFSLFFAIVAILLGLVAVMGGILT